MKSKSVLLSALVATFVSWIVPNAWAQPKTVKIVVGYAAGGAADATARIYADKLSQVLNTPVIVENKPGAFEQLAAQAALSAPPDGSVLWLGTAGALTMGPGVRNDIPYDVLKSFTHLGRIGEVNAVFAVKNDLPVTSMAELVTYAKANPNKLFYGSAGVGSGSHLLAEYIMSETGIKMSHVPYKGDIDVVRELVTGTVDFGIITVTQALPYLNDRKFKAIAVTGTQRATALPNVPTIGEAGIEPLRTMGVYSIYALLGPAGMPPALTQSLSDALNKVAKMPETTQRLDTIFVKATVSSPADLKQYLEAEQSRWRTLGSKLNIQFN